MGNHTVKDGQGQTTKMRLALRELHSARQTLRERGPSGATFGEVEKRLTTAIGYLKGETRPAWPMPLMDKPDTQTIEEWLLDTGCEATDGCWVEHDGVCHHGHPSWFLVLGLI